MSFDLTRTRYFYTKEVPVAPAATIAHEGAVAKAVLSNGEETALLTAGDSATEAISGFTLNSNLIESQRVVFEAGAVPAVAPYTVQLAHGNIVSGQVLVYNVTAGSNMTVVGGAPAAGEVQVNLVSGLLTFNVAQAGAVLQIRYKYNLSALESILFNGERPVNAKANSAAGTITLIQGNGELYTDQYDVTKDFSAIVGVVFADANGIITTTSAGKSPITGSRVIHVPTAADPFLGIKFDLA